MQSFGFTTKRSLVTALALCVSWPSIASAGCVWSDLTGDGTRVAKVAGAPRVYFVADDVSKPGCPAAGAACRERAFVVPGDVVLIGASQNGFVCAGYQSGRGVDTIGFLPAAALTPLPAAAQRPGDWAGNWTAAERDIAIKNVAGGALNVSGEASWGMGDKWRRENGGVHTGEVNGTARPAGGVLAFAEGENEGETVAYEKGAEYCCRVRMTRRGPYLLVRDNNACGGANVSFSGFYRRK